MDMLEDLIIFDKNVKGTLTWSATHDFLGIPQSKSLDTLVKIIDTQSA